MKDKGVLAVVSGFSGAGKGTLMKALLEKYDNYALSISATTRSPKAWRGRRKRIFFRNKGRFEEMIRQDELIEYARYVENYYGTPKEYVTQQMEAGKDVILEIEIQGALKVKTAVSKRTAAVCYAAQCCTIKRTSHWKRNRGAECNSKPLKAGC